MCPQGYKLATESDLTLLINDSQQNLVSTCLIGHIESDGSNKLDAFVLCGESYELTGGTLFVRCAGWIKGWNASVAGWSARYGLPVRCVK